ncbi:hypothetical protein VD0002_g5988 [Verticillium dahliae]|nr:hypothetical protein VD0002_g5988 [Verticillium dahliae]
MQTILTSALTAALLPAGLASPTCTVESCLTAASVPWLDDTAPDWTVYTSPYNLRLPAAPRLVVPATSVAHIQDAVRCAARHGLKVAPRSGGHGYATNGLGGEDGHVVIQLDRMFGVRLREDGTAIFNAGSRLGHIATELFAQGGRAISQGLCPSVGLGGHAAHGGFGFSSHTHGLTLDAVIGVTVVLADGSLVHASEKENADLFWALRGAGSSFGIIVEFEVKTFTVPKEVSWFAIASNVAVDKETAFAGIKGFQDFVDNDMPPELNLRLSLTNYFGSWDNKLEVLYHGSEADGRAALEPLNDLLKFDWTSERTSVGSGDWMAGVKRWADGLTGPSVNITFPYQQSGALFFATSLMTKKMPEASLEGFVDYWQNQGQQPRAWFVQMDAHGGANSAVAAVPKDATSYVHRDKLWLFQYVILATDAADREPYGFLNRWIDAVIDGMPDSDWGRYANYIDPELSQKDALEQYYGQHLSRLEAIKTKVDPTDLFHFPQGILPQ